MLSGILPAHRPLALSLFLILIIDVMGFGLLTPLLPTLVLGPHAPLAPPEASAALLNALYGVALGLFFLGAFVGQPLLGAWSDRYGRRRILLVCVLGTALGYAISAWSIVHHNLGVFLLGRTLDGLTAGAFPVAQAAMIDMSPEASKSKYLGLVSFAGSCGFVMGPLAPMLFAMMPWLKGVPSAALWLVSGLSVCSAVMILLFYQDTVQPKVSEGPQPRVSVLQAFRQVALRDLLWLVVLYEGAWGLVFFGLPLLLDDRFHVGVSALSLLIVVLAVGFAVASLWGAPRSMARWGARRTYTGSLVVLMVSSMLVLIWPGLAWQHVWLLLIGVGAATTYTAVLVLASERVGPDRQGWIMGVLGSICCLMFLLDSVLIGGASSVSPMLNMALGVVCFLGTLPLVPRLRSPA